MEDSWIFGNTMLASVLQIISLLILAGAVGALGFAAAALTRRSRPGSGDRNWRFLFSCWADSALIMVLYGAANLVWLFERANGLRELAAPSLDGPERQLQATFVVLTVETVIYVAIVAIAIRLVLRLRRYLEHVDLSGG